MKQNLFLLSIGGMLLGIPAVRGQSSSPNVLNNSGGYGVIDGNTFEWSIGEIVVSTQTGGSIIVTQGLLQPRDGKLAVPDTKLGPLLNVFPNPSTSIININFNAPAEGTLAYKLMDVTGKLVMDNSYDVKQGTTVKQIDIRVLANATYILNVIYTTDGNPSTSTYKVQKIN